MGLGGEIETRGSWFFPPSVLHLIPFPLSRSSSSESLPMTDFRKGSLNFGLQVRFLVGAGIFTALHAVRGERTFQMGIHPLQRDIQHKRQEVSFGDAMDCRELAETIHPPFLLMKRSRVNPSIGYLI